MICNVKDICENVQDFFFQNLKQYDLVERSSEVSEDTIKKIVDEQEIEIEKLKNQLHENVSTNIYQSLISIKNVTYDR